MKSFRVKDIFKSFKCLLFQLWSCMSPFASNCHQSECRFVTMAAIYCYWEIIYFAYVTIFDHAKSGQQIPFKRINNLIIKYIINASKLMTDTRQRHESTKQAPLRQVKRASHLAQTRVLHYQPVHLLGSAVNWMNLASSFRGSFMQTHHYYVSNHRITFVYCF